MDYKGKLALITGGSSGIGLAIATELAARGTNLLLISRNSAKLDAAKANIESSAKGSGVTVETLPLNVADYQEVQKQLGTALGRLGVPDFVINCAGFAHPAYFEDIPNAIFREMIDVNLGGVWNVLQAVVPAMKKRGSGHIASVSSIVGTFSFVGYSGYSATKFGVIGLSEAIRNELSVFGITVQTVLAPDTDTPGFVEENKSKPHETHVVSGSSKVHSPEAVAKAFLKQFGKRKFFIVYGYMAFVHTLFRLFPWLVRGVFDMDYKKARKQVEAGAAATHPKQ
ncbi:MAG TPA: SDR family oxidoreductase [Spirochaetia bacterium]|nr:SDR family oxidoreductase [Spirochaetia bacterium]